jgi:hypothetical protein
MTFGQPVMIRLPKSTYLNWCGMNDGQAILLTVASTVVGSLASWYISRWYYLKSGPDLDAALRPLGSDSKKMLQALSTVGRMMEQAGIGKPTFDPDGNLTGVAVTGSANLVLAPVTLTATGTCSPPPQYDRQHEQPRREGN